MTPVDEGRCSEGRLKSLTIWSVRIMDLLRYLEYGAFKHTNHPRKRQGSLPPFYHGEPVATQTIWILTEIEPFLVWTTIWSWS